MSARKSRADRQRDAIGAYLDRLSASDNIRTRDEFVFNVLAWAAARMHAEDLVDVSVHLRDDFEWPGTREEIDAETVVSVCTPAEYVEAMETREEMVRARLALICGGVSS